MHKLILFLSLTLIGQWTLHAAEEPNWDELIDEIQHHPDQLNISRIYFGASNTNYHLVINDEHYFIRFAPLTTAMLYASQEIEYEVLCAVSALDICAKPLYYIPESRAIVTTYLPHLPAEVDLLDPTTAKTVCQMLHQIDDAHIHISRIFHSYADTRRLYDVFQEMGASPLPPDWENRFLPALEQIDSVLSRCPQQTLCHLDLHHKNVLMDGKRLFLVDWEYATMSHPYLILGSMASIERWSDAQMYQFLEYYTPNLTEQDLAILYLYRIVADLFWTAWNHAQNHCSSLDSPYSVWRDLFYKAAEERLTSAQWPEAINLLKQSTPKR